MYGVGGSEMSKDHYNVRYNCSNCGYSGLHSVPFGQPAPHSGIICDNCGCNTCYKASPCGNEQESISLYPHVPNIDFTRGPDCGKLPANSDDKPMTMFRSEDDYRPLDGHNA